MDDFEIIEVEEFKVLLIDSKPPRIEAKIIFDRDHISQQLIFTLMDIAHKHGFGLSAPTFSGEEDPTMVFLLGTILPSKRSLKKYLEKIKNCLIEIQDFASRFEGQLDFSQLDISMFNGVDLVGFYPEHLVALRDQHFFGSWDELYKAMVEDQRTEDAELIKSCIEFESTNNKDIGLVGHKLGYMLHMLEQTPSEGEIN